MNGSDADEGGSQECWSFQGGVTWREYSYVNWNRCGGYKVTRLDVKVCNV